VSASESQPKQPPRPAHAPPLVAKPIAPAKGPAPDQGGALPAKLQGESRSVPRVTPGVSAKPTAPAAGSAPKNEKIDQRAAGRPAMPQTPLAPVAKAAPAVTANPIAPAKVAATKNDKGDQRSASPEANVHTPSPTFAKATPGVVGALAKAGARTTTAKPPPFSSAVGPPAAVPLVSTAVASRPKGRAEADSPSSRSPTLIIDDPQPGHPAANTALTEPRVNNPPLVVPSAQVVASNAVTKSPPWTETASEVGRALSLGVRAPAESVREITSSLLLEDSEEKLEPYELSSSLLIEDTSQVDIPPPVRVTRQGPPKEAPELVIVPGDADAAPKVDRRPSPDVAAGTAGDRRERPVAETRPDAFAEAFFARLRLRMSIAMASFVWICGSIGRVLTPVGWLFAPRRARWSVPVVALIAVVAGAVFFFGTRWKTRGREYPRAEDKLTASLPDEAALVHPGGGPAGSAPEVAPAAPSRGCVVAGPSRVVAENAILAPGVEVRALRTGIGLGFVPADHQATVMRVDPKTLAVGQMVSARAPDVIRRVTPVLAPSGAFAPAIDEDVKNDKILGRRTIPVEPPIQVGTVGGQLAWSRLGGHAASKLWAVDTGADVDAIRGAWAPGIDHGLVALTFRRAGAVWVGALDTSGAPTASGGLARIAGLGPAVGSPAIAFDGATVMVAWADRAASDDPWRLRWVRFRNGDAPGEPSTFSPPTGGRGGQAMSPGLAVVPGIGFLLSWTEGAMSAHDVRALTLANDGAPIGAALTISSEGVNAGQGQAAIDLEGHGLVAFLQGGGSVFQVAATPITCPVRSSQ